MPDPEPRKGDDPVRPGAAVATVAAGVLLLVVVVVATGSAGGSLGHGRSVAVGQGIGGFMVGATVLLLAIGLWIWFVRISQGGAGPERQAEQRRWPWWLRSLVGVAFIMVLILAVGWLNRNDRTPPPTPTAASVAPGVPRADQAPGKGDDGVGLGFFVGLGAAVLLAGGLLATAVRRGMGSIDEPDDDDEPIVLLDRAPLARALTASLADLAREPDPRKAVIAAYVRMQAVLANAGVTRAASDTEPELLRRALARFGADAAPAEVLTELFERARYSPHAVDEDMRAAAIDAVRRLRDGLLVGS